jgi:hypothetical protein
MPPAAATLSITRNRSEALVGHEDFEAAETARYQGWDLSQVGRRGLAYADVGAIIGVQTLLARLIQLALQRRAQALARFWYDEVHHGGHAAADSRPRSAQHIVARQHLFGRPGQMTVHVNAAGEDPQAGGIQRFAAGGVQSIGQGSNAAIFNADI